MAVSKSLSVHKAILGVMGDIGAIAKNNKNSFQGYSYRSIDDVYNSLSGLLVKYGLTIIPSVVEKERDVTKTEKKVIVSVQLTIKYLITGPDGSVVESVVVGEGLDSSDKATSKALSMAYKYAMFQIFCIPTEEFKDADADSLSAPAEMDLEAFAYQLAKEIKDNDLKVKVLESIEKAGNNGELLRSIIGRLKRMMEK